MTWWEISLRLLLAVTVGCVIGIERERKNRPAGMRTHVLVCVGAATIALIECMNIADTITLNMNNCHWYYCMKCKEKYSRKLFNHFLFSQPRQML